MEPCGWKRVVIIRPLLASQLKIGTEGGQGRSLEVLERGLVKKWERV
jgi:hypothetical protein